MTRTWKEEKREVMPHLQPEEFVLHSGRKEAAMVFATESMVI